MALKIQELNIPSLRGGMNDEDPPHALADDEAVLMENVEIFHSTLGERRAGCEEVVLTSAGFDDVDVIVHIAQRFIENDVTNPEAWVMGAELDTEVLFARRSPGIAVWTPVTPVDTAYPSSPEVYQTYSQNLHGKLFFSYKPEELSAPDDPDYDAQLDRIHVWAEDADGDYSLRRAGLWAPEAAPTAADAGSGSVSGVRYYRVRFIEMTADEEILRRSEPSEHLEFTPSGSGASVTITRPAVVNEGETHWELEASFDDATFYVIATVAIATTTASDTVDEGGTYFDEDEDNLSPEIGEYLTLPSAKFLAADADRLLLGGHWTDPTKQSRIYWTPVFNDPGVGNDERLPLSVDNFVDLDNYEGGALTGISQLVNGSWYAFKWGQIYKLIRTGVRQRAYEVVCMSKSRGALPGSIVSGMDEYGRACIYFIDPIAGPSRLSAAGLQVIRGLKYSIRRVNLKAQDQICCGVYYPDKEQVQWWLATGGSETPNFKIVLQVCELREEAGGTKRGWTVATGRSTEAVCVGIVNELVEEDDVVTLSERPYIGLAAPYLLQRLDAGETDAGLPYKAIIRSKPYLIAGLLNRWGAMTAALLAGASRTAHLSVKFIRNFGSEENQIFTDLNSPTSAQEEYVVKVFDNLHMSQATSIQFEISDSEPEDETT